MKKILILTLFNDFEFPLREAGRKQAWWMANDLKKSSRVDIFYNSEVESDKIIDQIRVFSDNCFMESKSFNNYDEVRVVTSALEFRLIQFIKKKKKIKLYILDGQPIPFDYKYPLRKIFAKICSLIFYEINILSDYQKANLGIKKAKKFNVFLPSIDSRLNEVKKTSYPSILYMGHLKKSKGVDYLINSSDKLIKKYPNIKITFAINGLHSNISTENNLKELHKTFPDNIVVKGVIDPLLELSSTWIYTYPFRSPHGTMAYALSIYEALSLNCCVIASDVGSNKEFFEKIKYLKRPSIYEKFDDIKNQLFKEICTEIDDQLLLKK